MEVDMFSKVEDFLKDDDFIDYVLNVAPETSSPWEIFLGQHSVHNQYAQEAKAILLAPVDVLCGFSTAETSELKDKIQASLASLHQYNAILLQ